MRFFKSFMFVLLFSACVDSQYGGSPQGSYPSYPGTGYPAGAGYPPGTGYPGVGSPIGTGRGYPNQGYYPPPDCSYYGNCGTNQGVYQAPNWNRNRNQSNPPPVRIPSTTVGDLVPNIQSGTGNTPVSTGSQNSNVILPSCPSGTQFNGRHCQIVDQRLRKPGGDGNINPCPKGMWVSGDRCVGN